jgi:hypothetical protein
MNSPRVTELPRRLEPVARDPFVEREAADVVALRPSAEDARPAPQPPRRAA